ncbi:solute carrier family 17 member 9 [Microplitis demolitor]|uniref:solute carrier family 17 member 9 n=1 Tax=Microplitis demolitor TaxID=69319 RepID=UPI0004CCE8FF|nr:solute carrier family 17 member 9 [Microplitis demolitor]
MVNHDLPTHQLEMPTVDFNDDSKNCFWTRQERRAWFISLYCGTCLLYATRTSVPLLMPVVSKEKQWSKADSGMILSSFFWGYTLTQVASGYISDRMGGQRVMWIAALGWSLTTFFMSDVIEMFSSSIHCVLIIAIARMLNGAFQGMHFPSVISLTSQHLEEYERASFFGLLTSGSALGTLLTVTLGSYLMKAYHWQIVFQVLGSLGFLWTIFLYYQSLKVPRKKLKMSIDDSIHSNLPWRQLWSKSPFWSCVFTHACQNNCFFVLLSWMPTYFHDTFPDVQSWKVNMIPWLSLVPCTFIAKVLSERLIKTGYSVTATRKIIETICLTTQSINLLILSRVTTFPSAMICLMLIIGGTGFHNTAIAVNPSDLAPKHSGSVFGIMNSIGAVPGFLGVYLAGHILHMTHSWAAVFILTSIIDALGCIVYLVFGSGQPII